MKEAKGVEQFEEGGEGSGRGHTQGLKWEGRIEFKEEMRVRGKAKDRRGRAKGRRGVYEKDKHFYSFFFNFHGSR